MGTVSFYTEETLNVLQVILFIVSLLVVVSTAFWSIYLLNEILLARKKLKYSLKYVINESIGTIRRKCKTDVWKNALLLLIGTAESISVLFAGLSSGTSFNILNLTKSCDKEFSIKAYQLIQFPAISMFFMTITFSSLNIITLFFIGIYSYHTEKNNHKKMLLFLCIQTSILIPIILIPYTTVYGMFICNCIMAIYSYKWFKNTQRLLLYLKWRFEDMKDECPLSANQIRVMRRRYRRLIYIIILTLQPVIASLFLDFIFQCLKISEENCTQYYMLQYLDHLISYEVRNIILNTLSVLITLGMVPVTAVLLIPYVLYTMWYFVGIVWRHVICRRTRSDNVLGQSLLKY